MALAMPLVWQVFIVGRSTGKQRATRQLMLVGFAIVLAIIAATQHDLLTALWSGLGAVATAGWLVLDKLPTKCGMPTKRGTACKRDTSGVLFGCQDHTWEKFFAWFGWRRRELARRYSRPSRAGVESDRPVNTVENGEERRGRFLFGLTVAASSAAIVSMITDLIGLFD
jgi:hypothetical protein